MLEDFKSAQGEKLNKERLIKEIENFILTDERFDYRILVGTD